MQVSHLLYKFSKFVLKTLQKTTNADIRTHGEENIPRQPIIFVINHFTRMETFFLPQVISKFTGNEMLSLAAAELFVGKFGRLIEKIGAVSTHAPDRDRTMMGALLRGDLDCMIFPEGQMIKDKKLIEKGKFMVYNSGIRRPPHTGAAILALRSEFYREKLKYFYENGYEEGIKAYCQYFNIKKPDQIKDMIGFETHILPVNVTYYPIRAHRNIINKLADKFVDNMPERLEEELEVEGSMIVDGVDIDINFGKPIPVKSYLDKKEIKACIETRSLCIADEEVKKDLQFSKEAMQLMYVYMNDIYSMTTINHDHIMSYILSKYKKNKIDERDFKNRVFLAIDKIKDKLKYKHTFLTKKQNHLLMDEDNDKYMSFIEAMSAASLICLEDGYIIKNPKRFSKLHEFHTIRKDNIIEVLKNEIEPLDEAKRRINRIMLMPSFFVRWIIRRRFMKRDLEMFHYDYNEHYKEGETKPEDIGRPQFIKKWFSRKGVLLIHGYLAAPEEVRELAKFLHKSGYNVYLVRLKGHGTSPEDLATRTAYEWQKSVMRGEQILRNAVKKMAIVGFSMGGGLALLQASRQHRLYSCVISINAPLKLSNIASHFASTIVVWNKLLDKLHIRKGKMEYVDNKPENPHINYFKNPVNGVNQLEKLMKTVDSKLKDVKIPALIIQGNNDPTVKPVSAKDIYDKLGSLKKELCFIEAENHVIVRGANGEKVFKEVKKFLKKNL